MTKTFIIEPGQKPTPEQLKEVEEAQKHPIVFDEDCAEAIFSAAMEAWDIDMPKETVKAMAGFGGGMHRYQKNTVFIRFKKSQLSLIRFVPRKIKCIYCDTFH